MLANSRSNGAIKIMTERALDPTHATHPGTITIQVRRLPEGVYLGTSADLPGLVVEADTREEVIDLAPCIALDLLDVLGKRADPARQRFAFVFDD